MKKRKTISTRTRFEILKRDGFTCQYCGKKPPVVVLNVDHIIAVSNGGGNEANNLVSACFDCNSGKSDIPISSVVQSLNERIKADREKAHQLAQCNEWLSEIKQRKDADFLRVSDALMHACGYKKGERVAAGSWAQTIKCLLKRLPAEQISEAVEIAHERFPFSGVETTNQRSFRYFCGVCWRSVDQNEGKT